ncbi:MAG TPA: acyclic terpene utilization AtuA family protein, partial [Ignavibacteria bacterium]|nr:acyclic terpene utilization AtuA family protein [Ignavibacteria bacterium]
MKEKILIASGQGFWGDLVDAPVRQASEGRIDYLVMDYLAEVTMSILQKQKLKNPAFGYAMDIPPLMEKLLPLMKERGFKVITNGGGVNPEACREAIKETAKKLGIKGLKIGVVLGDNILENMDTLLEKNPDFKNMETGEPVKSYRDRMLSANVYLGAKPVVDCLKEGADIV